MLCNVRLKKTYQSSILFFFIILIVGINPLFGRQVGKFSCIGDITKFGDDTTIVVSDTMVAMSERVRVFRTYHPDTISDTPSIFFIIDNSTSMSGENGIDMPGNRFTVTLVFIDSLMKYFPGSEVGLAVFSTGLYFNPADKPGIFQTVTSPTRMGLDSTGGFLPLLTLNGTYGSQTGYEILKEVLAIDTGVLTYPTILTSNSGTNINAAFDAALQAFTMAKFAKNNQFIFLFSNGEATLPQDGIPTAFTAAAHCPTTCTVFFTMSNQVPTSLKTYTTNCQVNNYSSSNPESQAWAYNDTTFKALMEFLRAFINIYIIKPPPIPWTLVLNGQSSIVWSVVDSTFSFNNIFSLTGQITPFNIQLINPKNETTTNNFQVQTQNGLASTWRNSYDVKLWDRDLVFQSAEGVTLTLIKSYVDSMQLRFDFSPGDANYHYTQAAVELFNTNALVSDREVLTLTKGTGNFFTGKIKRIVAPAATLSNGTLEHAEKDTFIAFFRNSETPKLPLDTFKTSIPFTISPNAIILTAATKDNNGNGYIDAINMTFDSDTSIVPTTNLTGFTVRFGSTTLPISAVQRTPGPNVRQWRLLISEPDATEPLQTFWTPTLQTRNMERIDDMSITCIDSVAPVIYRAINAKTDANDRTMDTVKVLFSEKIRSQSGTIFPIATAPNSIFALWQGNTSTSADNLLDNSLYFYEIVSDSIFYIHMTNGADLNADYWMSIKYDPVVIRDASVGNAPASNNRKVRIEILPGPHTRNGLNPLLHIKLTIKGKGSLISIEGIKIPADLAIAREVTLSIRIYNIAGKSIACLKPLNLFTKQGQSCAPICLSWDGLNNQGLKIAQGVYHAVVSINYPAASQIRDVKTIRSFGVWE
jgi:hypothetical protein